MSVLDNTDLHNILKLQYGVASGSSLWVVDPVHGNDSTGAGTYGSPFATILPACTGGAHAAVAGDVILLLRGTANLGTSCANVPSGVPVIGVDRKASIITGTVQMLPQPGGVLLCPGSNAHSHTFTLLGGVSGLTAQGLLGAFGNTQSVTGALVTNVDMFGHSDCIYMDSGKASSDMRVEDAYLVSDWDAIAVENQNSGTNNNTNGGIVVNNTLTVENFRINSTWNYPTITNNPSLGINCYNAAGTLTNQGNVTLYLKDGHVDSITATNNTNANPLEASGATAVIEAKNVSLFSKATGTGTAHHDVTAQVGATIRLTNVGYDPATVSIDSGKGSSITVYNAPIATAGSSNQVQDKAGYTLSGSQAFNNSGQTNPLPATYYPAATGTAPTSSAPAINNQTLHWAINYPVAQPFTFPNLDSTGWTQFVFTIKAKNTDPDSAALVTVKISNPSSGDGLTLLNGAVPVSPTTSTDGSITGISVSGSTNLTLNLTAYGHAIAAGNYVWELTRYSGGANTKYRMGTGAWQATQSVRANPVAS